MDAIEMKTNPLNGGAQSANSVTPPILLAMTAVTGIVDAVSFLALGRVFTANMTGNVMLLGFALGRTPGLSTERSFLALAFFLIGAVLGGRIDLAYAWRGLFLEAGLLGAASLLAIGLEISEYRGMLQVSAVIAVSAVAMGIRNAIVRKLAVPDLTTTVLTLTLTGLGADSSLAGGENPRWRRRVAAVLALLIGAAVGVPLANRSAALALGTCAAISGFCAVLAFWNHQRRTT
jgi:uncharacterized membrane protein YoaK (UPF0700 family)